MITLVIALAWVALATVAFAGLSALARVGARRDAEADAPIQLSAELPGLGDFEPIFASKRVVPRYARSEMLS